MFLYSSVSEHLGGFHLLAVVNQAAMNMGVPISVQVPGCISSGYTASRERAGSYGNSMFNFSNNCHTVFLRGCTISLSHQQCTQVPTSLHPRWHLLLSGFWLMAILTGMHFYTFTYFSEFPVMCILRETMLLWSLSLRNNVAVVVAIVVVLKLSWGMAHAFFQP